MFVLIMHSMIVLNLSNAIVNLIGMSSLQKDDIPNNFKLK
jgi:hypothetical protein